MGKGMGRMTAVAQADAVNWIGVIIIISIVAITYTIIRVKEAKYNVREDASGESNAEGNPQTPTNGTRR